MSAVLTFLTSRYTTALATLAGIALWFTDAGFIALLTSAGLSAAWAAKLTSGAKVVTYVLAALGYSPLKRPKPPEGAPLVG